MTIDTKKIRELEGRWRLQPDDFERNLYRAKLEQYLRNNCLAMCEEIERLREGERAADAEIERLRGWMRITRYIADNFVDDPTVAEMLRIALWVEGDDD